MLARSLRTSATKNPSSARASTRLISPLVCRPTNPPPSSARLSAAYMSTTPSTAASASAPVAAASKTQQPHWTAPVVELEAPVLKVWNSLTRSKVSSTRSSPEAVPPTPRAHVRCPASVGRVRSHPWSSGYVVQLWSDRVRCVAHGSRQVSRRCAKPLSSHSERPSASAELTRRCTFPYPTEIT